MLKLWFSMKNLFINKVEPSKWIAQVGIPDAPIK